METDRSYTQKLSILYANYFDAWRALFGEAVGGSLDAPARKP